MQLGMSKDPVTNVERYGTPQNDVSVQSSLAIVVIKKHSGL